ncbi:phosphoenolpyruvate mutase [Balamuthia mandrillaris]
MQSSLRAIPRTSVVSAVAGTRSAVLSSARCGAVSMFSTSSTARKEATKAEKLRAMLQSKELEFIMEAHNGLSAVIVEETGFKGIWASGLSISAQLGMRDSNEASYTQVLDVLECMSDRTSIPILLDGDTGYGNFNNARRLVQKLEQRGIAGVCLEDKLFPKTNSLLDDVSQPLADVEEFCGKIRACKDAQREEAFSVVARCEAFIAGWGLEEMLKRAEAYRKAGADAVLVHSKESHPKEIEAFMKEWRGSRMKQDCPVVIVPTKYYKTPTQQFRDMGVSMVIWANHNMRSAITAMQQTSKRIFEEQSLVNVEPNIASVKEVFRLQNNGELQAAEEKYLPKVK